MILFITKAFYLSDYKIQLSFSDGKMGIVDLQDELYGPIFEPLKEITNFIKFELNSDLDTILWYNITLLQ